MASPNCEVREGVGAFGATTNGVNVAANATVSVRLASTTDVVTWKLEVVGTDELSTAPVLTGVNAETHIVATPGTIVTFTYPNDTGRALLLQSTVIGGGTTTTKFGVYSLINSVRVGAAGETREGNLTFGWASKVNPLLRTMSVAVEPLTEAAVFSASPLIERTTENHMSSTVALADADATITLAAGRRRHLSALTANRVVTISTTGMADGDTITIRRSALGRRYVTFLNGGPAGGMLYVFAGPGEVVFGFDGTNVVLQGATRPNANRRVNPVDYGARGDRNDPFGQPVVFAGTDDTDALQATLDSFATMEEGVVEIPGGTFVITRGLEYGGDFIKATTIRGEGSGNIGGRGNTRIYWAGAPGVPDGFLLSHPVSPGGVSAAQTWNADNTPPVAASFDGPQSMTPLPDPRRLEITLEIPPGADPTLHFTQGSTITFNFITDQGELLGQVSPAIEPFVHVIQTGPLYPFPQVIRTREHVGQMVSAVLSAQPAASAGTIKIGYTGGTMFRSIGACSFLIEGITFDCASSAECGIFYAYDHNFAARHPDIPNIGGSSFYCYTKDVEVVRIANVQEAAGIICSEGRTNTYAVAQQFHRDLWISGATFPSVAIVSASNTTPVVITTGAPHGMVAGDEVTHTDIVGNDNANRNRFLVANVTSTTYEIRNRDTGANIVGSGAGTGGTCYPMVRCDAFSTTQGGNVQGFVFDCPNFSQVRDGFDCLATNTSNFHILTPTMATERWVCTIGGARLILDSSYSEQGKGGLLLASNNTSTAIVRNCTHNCSVPDDIFVRFNGKLILEGCYFNNYGGTGLSKILCGGTLYSKSNNYHIPLTGYLDAPPIFDGGGVYKLLSGQGDNSGSQYFASGGFVRQDIESVSDFGVNLANAVIAIYKDRRNFPVGISSAQFYTGPAEFPGIDTYKIPAPCVNWHVLRRFDATVLAGLVGAGATGTAYMRIPTGTRILSLFAITTQQFAHPSATNLKLQLGWSLAGEARDNMMRLKSIWQPGMVGNHHGDVGGFLATAMMTGSPQVTFGGVPGAYTIERSAGSWLSDGFVPDSRITVTGSPLNEPAIIEATPATFRPKVYTVASLTATHLTLISTDVLVAEGPLSDVCVRAGAVQDGIVLPDGFPTVSLFVMSLTLTGSVDWTAFTAGVVTIVAVTMNSPAPLV